MYAIVWTGGKQYKVTAGCQIDVEKLPTPVAEEVSLERVVLWAKAADEVQVGTPYVTGARVVAKVVHHGRAKKLIIFKHKPRTRYRRKQGHRQAYTRLLVQRIEG